MSEKVSRYQRRTSLLMVLSALTTAVTLFAIFRFTAQIVSVEWVGIWSLVQGLFLFARISDSGAGANISRVLAVRLKNDRDLNLRNLTLAALTVASTPSAILALITAPAISWYVLGRFGDELSSGDINEVIWLGLLNAILAAVANMLLAICEGVFQLNYKSAVIILGNLVGLSLLYPLLSSFGPAGIGWTYVAIAATQCVLASVQVFRLSRPSGPIGYRSVCEEISLIWKENLHLSGISLLRLSFEPATKLALSLIAPLTVIALFELALRVTTQIRIIIQSALQPLLVLGARSEIEHDPRAIVTFIHNDRMLSILTVGALATQILAAPGVQLLGLGFINSTFIIFFTILAAGNSINTMGLAGYYWQLSSGSLSPLVKVQAFMAVVNIGIGLLAIAFHSSVLAVAAYSCAFAFGGLASRSFLPGISIRRQLVSLCALVAGGLIPTAVIIEMHPSSSLEAIMLICAGSVGGLATLYIAYESSRSYA